MPIDPVSAALGVASLGAGLLGSSKARKSAKRAAKEQSNLTYEQRQEEIRQRRLNARGQRSDATARVYASNLQMTGTPKRYIDALDYENMREIAWAERAAEQERKAIRAGAAGAGDTLMYGAVGQALSFGIQSIFSGGSSTPTGGGGGTAVSAAKEAMYRNI